MSTEIDKLYARFRTLQFPPLGKQLGDFLLYDALFAGVLSRYMAGEQIIAEKMPIPDAETSEAVAVLRRKESLDSDEQEFMAYFDVMEKLRRLVLSYS